MHDRLAAQIEARPVLIAGLGGAATGLLSYLATEYIQGLRFSFVLTAGQGAPIIPGLIFGILVAAWVARCGLRDKIGLASVVVLTAIAWIAAYDCTIRTHAFLQSFQPNAAAAPQHPAGAVQLDALIPQMGERTENLPFIMGAAGMIGGLVGGLGTVVAVALVDLQFRRSRHLLAIVGAATLLGALVELMAWIHGDWPALILFVCWQAGVSALIARALLANDGRAQRPDIPRPAMR